MVKIMAGKIIRNHCHGLNCIKSVGCVSQLFICATVDFFMLDSFPIACKFCRHSFLVTSSFVASCLLIILSTLAAVKSQSANFSAPGSEVVRFINWYKDALPKISISFA